MRKAKDFLRRFPILFRVLKYVNQHIYTPICSGYVLGYIHYLIFLKKREVNRLGELGFRDIVVHAPLNWRYGKGKDKAYRRYYIANIDGKKCFVKVATKTDSTIANEILMNQTIEAYRWPFMPECIMSLPEFSENTRMIANAFCSGLRPFTLPESIDEMAAVCDQFVNILDSMNDKQFVHADIHEGNLMLDDQNRVVILDLGISRFTNVMNAVDYSARPGKCFREFGVKRRYDDAHSLLCMLERSGIPEEWKNNPSYMKIVERVDRCYFDISMC